MKTIVLFGASDDLIEIRGDLVEEFSVPYNSEPAYVLVSTGDVIRWRLEREGWRATVVHNVSNPTFNNRHDPEEDDVVTITGDIKWVACGPDAPLTV